MRRVLLSCILSFIVPAGAWAQIQPLLSRDVDTAAAATRFVDRSGAPEILRTSVHARVRIVPNLRQDGVVETLDHAIALPSLAKIVADGATSIRARISGLPPGTTVWVAGEDDPSFERIDNATWTPTITGPAMYISIDGPHDDIHITQLVLGIVTTNTQSACTLDVACNSPRDLPEVTDASRAIALLRFVRGDASYVCTGGLINDSIDSHTPYLLTAHHCISTEEEAASIEAVWDYRPESCGGAVTSSLKRTYGAELLVTSADTDVTLLRLHKLPANRVFLGVALDPVPSGTAMYRVSHADGSTQVFSSSVVDGSGLSCSSAPRGAFLYTSPTRGAVSSGSSGAPLLMPGLRVVGQLLGLCGASPSDPCAIYNEVVDGSISASWPLLATYLDPVASNHRRAAGH
jgi:Trypsin-like peptidase domain